MDQKTQVILALFIIICLAIGYFTSDMPFSFLGHRYHPHNCQCPLHKKPVDVQFNRPSINIKNDNTDKRANVNNDVIIDRSYPEYPSQTEVSSESEVYQCSCDNGRVKKPLRPSFTEMPDKLCSECGEVMPYYDRHIHVDCDICGGKGYYTIQ